MCNSRTTASFLAGATALLINIGAAFAGPSTLPACTADQKKLPGDVFQCRNGNKPDVKVMGQTSISSCDGGTTKNVEPLRGQPVCRDEENNGYKVTIRVQTANCGQ